MEQRTAPAGKVFKYSKLSCLLSCIATMSLAQASPKSNSDNLDIGATLYEESQQEQDQTSNALYELSITGIENEDATSNAYIYTELIPESEMDASERNLHTIRREIEKAISVYGYFNPTIKFTVTPSNSQDDKGFIEAKVEQGEPTRIDSINVKILGEGQYDPAFQQLLTTLPKPHSILNQEDYDKFKENLRQLTIERGYFDAEFLETKLVVRPSTNQSWWDITLQTGKRYHFGTFKFIDNKIKTEYLQNSMLMKSGDPYDMDLLTTYNNDLSSSGWFSSVIFRPSLDRNKKLIDMDFIFYPRKKNIFKIGVGYSSDEKARLQLGWVNPWINRRGQSLRGTIYLSKPKINAGAVYRIPVKSNPLRYYYDIGIGAEHENQNNTKSTATTFAVMRYWERLTGWQNSIGIKMRYDSFTQANQSYKTFLLYPSGNIIRTRLDNERFPLWGDTQSASFDWGQKIWGSEVNFIKSQISTSWIRTYKNRHRFLWRAEVGYLHSKNFDRIPPALRFFIGGERTLRGYGYKKIAPKDSAGQLIGGKAMATASVEYNFGITPNWWVAAFFDTGLAANNFSTKNLRYGSGVGVRWVSPIGAVRLNVAMPVKDPDHSHNVQFYIGLGTEL